MRRGGRNKWTERGRGSWWQMIIWQNLLAAPALQELFPDRMTGEMKKVLLDHAQSLENRVARNQEILCTYLARLRARVRGQSIGGRDGR